MYPVNYLKYLCFIFLVFASIGTAQNVPGISKDVFVDDNGIMRWKGNNAEVSLFGVNYTTPFAYAYRAHKKLGLSLKKSIDIDVAQMVRLGLDAFRVHVWDREISDKEGNILKNEHLDLFDYLLSKLEANNIKIIITPIAWWGNGWPEPDEKTKGFSELYSKKELITNQEARRSERNYLNQFVNHLNHYTKTTYKNDPSVIAMEIINEPFHPDNGKDVTDYINEMVKVIRDAGYSKPLFYNISQNWNEVQAQAVSNADIQGVSFQWYPTDLVHNKMLKGNYLINVNHYSIPSESITGYNKKTKMVYEFEAADVGGSYMYPAMARAFRESKMQFAAMFAYDPSQIAWSNTEYPTHFLNLLYTPSKAISLLIASGAFHSLPLGKSFGEYPANNKFGDFRVDYENDLSIMNSDTAFYYSNSTEDNPRDPSALKHIAGCGNSPLVKYEGTGAYFLDKLEDGIWKLEIYPDALWLKDPFKPTSLFRQVARLYWNQRKISILIPGLGKNFVITQLDSRKRNSTKVLHTESIMPGVYLLTGNGVSKEQIKKYFSLKINFLDGLYTPSAGTMPVSVVNFTKPDQVESELLSFNFKIASDKKISGANLYIKRIGWRGFAKYPLSFVSGFDYVFTDSLRKINKGKIQYCVSVKSDNKEFTFPGGIPGSPDNWDFYSEDFWNTDILQSGGSISLLDVSRDREDFVFPHFSPMMRYNIEYKIGTCARSSASVGITYSLNNKIPFGLQLNISGLMNSLKNIVNEYKYVVIRARSIKETNTTIGLNFLSDDGKNFGAEIELTKEFRDIELPLSSFKSCSALILPASYPLFLPKIWNPVADDNGSFKVISKTGSIQIICGNQKTKSSEGKTETSFEIESVCLKK